MLIWLGLAAAALILVWLYWRSRRTSQTFSALVTLLREPRMVDAQHVRNAVRTAGLDGSVEEGEFPKVRIGGTLLEVVGGPVPYGTPLVSKEQLAKDIRELHLREAYLEHEGFFSVVIVETDLDRDASLGLAGRLVAELLDESAIAVWDTVSGRMNLITPEFEELFRSGNVREAMEQMAHDGISEVSGHDPRMRKAVAEAQRRWPEFVAAFLSAEDRDMFIAKGPFTDGEHTEWMWVNVTEIEPSRVIGVLVSKPYRLRNFNEGDTVAFPLEDLNDWLCPGPDGEPLGAFTEAIVRGG